MTDTNAFPDFPMHNRFSYGFASDLIETLAADVANDNLPRRPGDSLALLKALATAPVRGSGTFVHPARKA